VGTTRGQAGSSANFIKIDQDYVVAGAKAALSEEKENKQRLIYCSSAGANTKSRLPYLHSKGMTEDRLSE
jgi:oxidoreductase